MKEELRHREAFEYYYSLGDTRTLPQVNQKFKVSLTSIKRWSGSFNWQDRVFQRDLEISKEMELKTNRTVIDTKGDYRAEIKTQFSILKKMLNKLIEQFKDNKGIEIKDVTGLKDILGCYEKLIKMDLILMGETSEIEEIEAKGAKDKLIKKIEDMIKRVKVEKKAKRYLGKNKKS